MFNNQMFQGFVSGFLSVFRLGTVPIKYVQTLDIAEYFCKIENDINKSYQELKEHERN
jgi:hypothetical protein|tara:strand:- start:1799 stop:1972 length:174 start_codon:yes stop_codon:yes gene_type:complete